jgi:hypothetical protein
VKLLDLTRAIVVAVAHSAALADDRHDNIVLVVPRKDAESVPLRFKY